ncbi:MAG: DnaA/Hda family protein [Rhizobiaceae bacterium]|jgi:chromosomal replication initiation ATPase DnaA|nr:DnaA/Hda family protein [Rhizobiaceae bacterium]
MAAPPPRQLVLDLPFEAASGDDALFVSPANAAAVRLIERWPAWPGPIAMLVGPPGSGKSHLANLWALKAGAERRTSASIEPIGDGVRAVLIDPLDGPPDALLDETGLFHLVNALKARDGHLLLTSVRPPAALGVALPDLMSRLKSATIAAIDSPSDADFTALLGKLAADRQLDMEPGVVEFLLRRIERSHAAARAIIAELDAEALSRGARVTRKLAADVLRARDAAAEPDLF